MKIAAVIKDDIKVITEFPCLLGHPVSSLSAEINNF